MRIRTVNEIAQHVRVSHSTVAKYRAELESSCQIGKMRTRTVSRGSSTHRQNTTKIEGKRKRVGNRKPSRRMASRIQKPTRAPNPMEKITALSMPHNPVSGARTLIEIFDADCQAELQAGGEIPHLTNRTRCDGKQYPASQSRSAPKLH